MPSPSPVRVLVVDDEEDFVKPLAYRLRAWGTEVHLASNGKQALRMIREDPPDIVFLDINMPELNGPKTLRRLRFFEPKLPVIMLTAHPDDPEVFSNLLRLGISGFFPKQGDLSGLKVLVETALKVKLT